MASSDRKQCLDMMERMFLRDEPLCQVLDVQSDLDSISTIRSNWEKYADQGICVACYTEVNGGPRDLVGCNILLVRTTHSLDEEVDIENVAGETWRKLLRTLVAAEQLVDVFEHYQVDRYLTSSGLAVAPEHRGHGVGARLLAAREAICEAFGLEAVATVFTARSSQVLAGRCGYNQLAVLPYEDMMQHGVDLRGCTTPCAILMGIKYKMQQHTKKR